MRAAIFGCVAAAFVAGCGNGDPCDGQSGVVCISATVKGSAKGIDQLSVTVDKPTSKTETTPGTPGSLSLPVQFAITLPAGTTGSVNIGLEGLSGATVVGHTSQAVTLPASGHAKVTFTLDGNGAPPPPADMAPALAVSGAATTGYELQTLTVGITVTGNTGLPMLTSDNLPTGASFVQPTATTPGAITWTPTYAQGQTTPYSIDVTATDGANMATTTVMVTVMNAVDPAPGLAPGDSPSSNLPGNLIGDFNGDGFGDLASCSLNAAGTYEIDLLYGDADGLPTTTPPPAARRQAYTFSPGSNGNANPRLKCVGGDLDGDHMSDIILADPGANGGKGQLYVVFGTARTNSSVTVFPAYDPSLMQSGEALGSTTTFIGDVNGDGLSDFVVQTYPSGISDNIYVFPGVKPRPSGGVVFYGSGPGSAMATVKTTSTDVCSPQRQLQALGDIDGDGKADILVSDPDIGGNGTASGCPTATGGISITKGAGGTITIAAPTGQQATFGQPSTLCDVNANGKADFVTIDPNGAADVYPAVLLVDGTTFDPTMAGIIAPATTGHTFSHLGCVPGFFNGGSLLLADLAVPVSVSIVGKTTPLAVAGTLPNPVSPPDTHFGESFGSSSDVNGDGKPDLLVGANMGSYWVVYGR